jgi:hypothetical protein
MALMFLILDCHPVLQIEAYQDAGFERKVSEMVMGAGVARECRSSQYRGDIAVGD